MRCRSDARGDRKLIIIIPRQKTDPSVGGFVSGAAASGQSGAAAGYDLLPQVEPHVSKKLRQRLTRVPV